jgi:outer membrane protein TolC
MAEAGVRGALAEEAGARLVVESELRALLAELDRAGSLLVLYRDEILPTARANVTSSLASYRVGETDFATLVDAQLAVDRYEQDFEQLVADYGSAVERIEAAIGGPLDGPRISPTELTLPEPGNDG